MLAPILDKLGPMAFGTVDPATTVSAVIRIQQLLQDMTPDLLHRCPNGCLTGFQVQVSQSLPITKRAFYGTLDFFFDLLLNCLDKVFFKVSSSFSSSISRAGRFSQIFSLTSTNSLVSSTKRR